jgi:hypothetical protein
MVLDISKVLTDQELRGVTAVPDAALLSALPSPAGATIELR